MRSDSATVPTETAHGSTNRAGGPGKVPTCGWPGKARTGEAIQGRLGHRSNHEHGGLYGPGAEPVQGFLARVSRSFALTNFASRLGKRGCPQANRVTLTKSCRRNNSSGDGLGDGVRLTGEGQPRKLHSSPQSPQVRTLRVA